MTHLSLLNLMRSSTGGALMKPKTRDSPWDEVLTIRYCKAPKFLKDQRLAIHGLTCTYLLSHRANFSTDSVVCGQRRALWCLLSIPYHKASGAAPPTCKRAVRRVASSPYRPKRQTMPLCSL